jgi:tol-pal system protein YbgF
MRKSFFPAAAILLLSVTALPPRAHAVAKEIIELQTQVSQLQDMISQMKQSNDERMGVLLHMVQQNADSITRMTTQVGAMQQAMSSQNENQQLSGQMQALNDSVDELKTRIGKLDATLQSVQAQLQNVQNPSTTGPTQPAGPAPVGPGGMAETPAPGGNLAPQPTAGIAAPLQQTYQAALRDYNSAKYDLSNSEFSDVVKYYPQDDLAGNAHFYMGEIAYRQGKYPQAVKQYDVVLEQFAGNPKAPAAQLRKGESLLQTQQREAGAEELRSLIQRYPQTPEAAEARSKLNGMGIRINSKPTAYRR